MFNSSPNLPESEFLKSLLGPLLDDFLYWFGRSRSLLECHKIDFLSEEEQAELLQRVQQSQKEVEAARLLLNVTDGKAGLDTAVLMPWHRLVTECWQVGMRFRTEHPHLDS